MPQNTNQQSLSFVKHDFQQTTKPFLVRNYLDEVPLDREEIPSTLLNIDNKKRSNLFPWNGQFSPQFVEVVLKRYANSKTRIIDPFCGSGTVLSEAARLGLAATGIEINPAAYLLARIYSFCNLPHINRHTMLDEIETKIHGILPRGWPETAGDEIENHDTLKNDLVSLCKQSTKKTKIILDALIILSDFYKKSNTSKFLKTWAKLRELIENLPYSINPTEVHHRDGRFLDALPLFDLVLTSPPYINVYNYHQQYRASAEALGWDLLDVAKSEIGSNRKHRGNRFLTVVQYCLDITLALQSLWKATSENARLIFVLGRESRVRGVPFLNSEIVARLAIDAVGYRLLLRQERVFMNRFGQRIYEDILHFTKDRQTPFTDSQEKTRKIASQTLKHSLIYASDEVIKHDLLCAIEKVDFVMPSPRFFIKIGDDDNS